jgi:hypothetical protein
MNTKNTVRSIFGELRFRVGERCLYGRLRRLLMKFAVGLHKLVVNITFSMLEVDMAGLEIH